MVINLEHFFNSIPPFFRRRKFAKLLLAISPASKIQSVKFNDGAQLYADISDRFPLTYFLTQSYDEEYLQTAASFLNHGGHYFDIGANFGFCTFGLLPLLKNKPVTYHLFEANPSVFQCLQRSAQLHPTESFQTNHCAVTDTVGESKLFFMKGHQSASFLSDHGSFTIKNLRLDDYIREKKIQRIEFLKIDIEGSEPNALKGGETSLRSGTIKTLYTEISGDTLKRFGKTTGEYLSQIRDLGFELFYIKENDFKTGAADISNAQILKIGNATLKLAPVKNYPANYDTDVLAVHKSAGLLLT